MCRASRGRTRPGTSCARFSAGSPSRGSPRRSAPRLSISSCADDRDSSARPCYDARDLTRMYEHLTEVSTAINGLGWSNYANDHEDGNGRFEQNFAHAEPMTTADRLVTFRYLVQVLAEQRGMTATFMPKPFTDRTGTGLHMHMSLWREREPLFPDPADPRGLGLSSLAYQFIGACWRMR